MSVTSLATIVTGCKDPFLISKSKVSSKEISLLLSISSIALVTIPSISFLVLLIREPYFLFSSTLISFSPDKISIIRLFLPTYFDLTFNMSASLLQVLSSPLKLATICFNSSSINSILPKKTSS